ncbi:RluA family pseudouridine synthase [Vibrio sinaloensis]|uniref:RluA family pseudouridine synthase n=1 Tax=Photobacterium sp. (strain ATCC 43367) TaxID=379097 RepID=UPI0020539249|nr:RluA family pseudouridine synthase [Vibrio sinaloensis]UPQ89734.1 pseudouridine synthase [Vibrio sinaloensis]
MSHTDPRFTRFNTPIQGVALPEKYTFPFYYQPHPLCVQAAEQLQQHLSTQTHWQHNFGLDGARDGAGKMFGVLLVRNPTGEIGFLSAFSGKVAEQNLLPGFVPPVFDMLTEQSFFKAELAEITELSKQIAQRESCPTTARLKDQLNTMQTTYQQQEAALRSTMIERRAERKAKRLQAEGTLDAQALAELNHQLGKQSVADKNQLKYLKLEWEQKLAVVEAELSQREQQLVKLTSQRASLSNALQNKLFEQYVFLNARGETRSLKSIFADTSSPTPPAGAGECAAPKLLHYAYANGYQPLAIAEFWWGVSPKSEIRQHGQFYPSCNSKCQPILGHMLQGLTVDDNPLEENWAEDKPLEILYQDDAMVVVNKPSGLLSVPGKVVTDSAYSRLQTQFPDVEGPFVIHRLDMATSGLLVFALTRRANKSLQKQFMSRAVNKRYVALLEGDIADDQGTIDLPMRGDPVDRPRQLVCFEHGKPAFTTWQKIAHKSGRTKLYLEPKTGRTHQLRVHCAHHLGLATPMVGDTLYGEKANRLHLHAERLELDHPYTKQRMTFQVDAEF